MKYSLNSNDHKSLKIGFKTVYNNWQARVTETLVGNYIENLLIPELKRQGWSEAIYARGWFFQYEDEYERPVAKQVSWNKEVQRFLIANGLYPTEKFLKTFKKLARLLEHTPDGYLLKFRKTGKVNSLKVVLQESDLRSLESSEGWTFGRLKFNPLEHTESEQITIVNGEIELIEVKSGKARLFRGQKEDYCNALREKFALRYFHVDVISFEKNEFEIEEKLITNLNELNANQHTLNQ